MRESARVAKGRERYPPSTLAKLVEKFAAGVVDTGGAP